MPRSGPLRSFSQSRKDQFAMMRPRLTAHATTAALQKLKDLKAPFGVTEAWQRDAYGYYEIIGEVAYSLTLTSKTLALCNFDPVEVDTTIASDGYKDTTDERVLRVWDAFSGPRGGKTELIRRAALHVLIAGESYLVGSPIKDKYDQDAGISWEFLSNQEVRVENNGKLIKRVYGGYAGVGPEELGEDTFIARLWQSDPQFAERADCALKHVLPICREIVVLTQVVDAIAKSRLSAGILFVPDEMSFGPYDETEDDADTTDEIDPFTAELIEQLTAPVDDRTSAASLVPLVMRGPAEFYDKVKLIEVARNLDQLYMDLRIEAIRRLVQGLEVPPELLLGKGGLNHWTGYNIDADYISKHVTPLGDMIAEFVTAVYLRPMLVEFEGMTEEEADKFFLKLDTSAITSQMDSGPNARAAYDRKELSADAYLRENGFDESDAPTPEEKMERDLRSLFEAEPVIYGIPVLEILYPELKGKLIVPGVNAPPPAPEPDPSAPGAAPTLPQRKNPTGPENAPVIDKGTGQGEPSPRGPRLSINDPQESLMDRLTTASDGALEVALERAGSRLISKMNGSHAVERDQFKTLPKAEVISNAPSAIIRTLGVTPEWLFEGAWDTLAVRGKGWIRQHFMDAGVDNFTADEKASLVVNCLTSDLDGLARSALKTPLRVGSNGFRVPSVLIQHAIDQAERID